MIVYIDNMPAKNTNKIYRENGYYHIYNRGVEKRTIFIDAQDFAVFLSYLKEYLMPKDEKGLRKKLADASTRPAQKDKILKLLHLNNFCDSITLLAYCLMPNHFHFLIKQGDAGAMDAFMSSIGTRYSMYFNRKHKRVGPLYQGVYKAVNVDSENQLLHLSRYIHRNPLGLQGVTLQTLSQWPNSYSEYLGKRKTDWVNTAEILLYFSKDARGGISSYEDFVRQGQYDEGIYTLLMDE